MARRRRANTIAAPGPAPAAPPRVTPLWLVAAGLAIAAGTAAWLVTGLLMARATVAQLPILPDRAALTVGVADDLVSADAAARRAPSAATVGALGLAYHAALRPDEALQAYALAAGLAGADWTWLYYRGLLLEERGDHPGAAAAYSRVISAAPEHGLAHFHLAEIAFKAGRLDEAEAAYQAASRSAGVVTPSIATPGLPARRAVPIDAYADVGLARVRLERGDVDGARSLLNKVASAHPGFGSAQTLLRQLAPGVRGTPRSPTRAYAPPPDPWLDVVITQSRHGDLLLKHAALATRSGDAAWREWLARRALDANPHGLDVLLEMAAVMQAANRHSEALEYLRRAETVAPDDHHTLVEIGQSLSELGQLPAAEAVLRRAVRVRDAAAEYNLGSVLDTMERWDEARTHYQRSLAIDPFHVRALNNLGVGLSRRGQADAAMVHFRAAIDVAPDDPDAYTNLGGLLASRGRFEEARAVLETAVAIGPNAPDAYNNLGIVLAQLNLPQAARQALEQALRLNPGHADARRNLAQLAVPR